MSLLVGMFNLNNIKSNANDRLIKKVAKLSSAVGSGVIRGSLNTDNAIIEQVNREEKVDSWLVSENECTDGCDDGKISFWSKLGNLVEGVAKTVVGGVKNFLSDPKNVAKAIGIGAVSAMLLANPVTAPVVLIAGAIAGAKIGLDAVKTVVDGVRIAESATDDATAKDAWEQIGNGTFRATIGVYLTYKSGKFFFSRYAPQLADLIRENAGFLDSEDGWFQIVQDSILDPGNLVDD